MPAKVATIEHMENKRTDRKIVSLFILVSNLLLFEGAPELLSMTFVSLPAYTATPTTHAVFFISHPRKIMLEDPRETFFPWISIVPENP